ncbi:MAG: flagellar assembly protein FliW [Lachnospiraceae bacterium]
MKITTRVFGEIEIDDEKIITFENGIIGFPELRKFTLMFDEEKEEKTIIWMQSIDEPSFALPVINPLFIREDYDPTINDELLKPLGELTAKNVCVLATITVPTDIKKISVNLKAPLVINVDERKGSQLIVEDEYPVHYEIYEILEEKKERAGE